MTELTIVLVLSSAHGSFQIFIIGMLFFVQGGQPGKAGAARPGVYVIMHVPLEEARLAFEIEYLPCAHVPVLYLCVDSVTGRSRDNPLAVEFV